MQILSSALPGFRDLRAPIIAGYMWLLFVWLLVDPNLDQPPDDRVSASLYDLLERLGPIWIAIGAGVIAYFIGSVSQEISRGLRVLWEEFGSDGFGSGGFQVRSDARLKAISSRGSMAIERANLHPGDQHRLELDLSDRAKEATGEASRELDLPATLLVGDQSELFAEVDRLRAEGELRMAVVPPLIVLMVFLTVQASMLWFFLSPLILVLFMQGVQRELDSKKSIADAIRIGRVESSSVSKFSQWVDVSLPAAIKEMEGDRRP